MQKYFIHILALFVLAACQGGKELAKFSKNQIITLKPEPLELHGGQVRGKLKIKLPAEIEKKMAGYEAQVIFNSKEFSGEIFQLSSGKTLQIDTSFAFIYLPNKTEYGDIIIQARIKDAKGKIYEPVSFTIGRGVSTTSLLFQQSPEPALYFYPFENKMPINQEILVFFEVNSAELSDSEASKIKNIREPVNVIGYFSPEGSEAKNYMLAQKRTEAVKKVLNEQKVNYRIQTLTFQEWKKYLQSLLDKDTQKQVEKMGNPLQINALLQETGKTDVFQFMRVARLQPAKQEKLDTIPLKDTTQWLAAWEKEIEKNPSEQLHHQIGTWYAQKFLKDKNEVHFQKAIQHFQMAIHLGARGETFYNYAYLLKEKNNPAKRDSLLKIALEKGCADTLRAQWLNEWQGLQKVQQALSAQDKNYSEALQFFEKSGKTIQSTFNKGLVNLLIYQYDKAAQLFEKIQDFPLALYTRAIVGMRKGNEQEATEWLKKTFEKDKNLKNKAQKDIEFWQLREKEILR